MMRRVAIGYLALLLAVMAAPARAELVIYAQETTVNPGGYGYLNVYLAGAPTDQFDNYQVTLSITRMGGAAGTVVFAPNGTRRIRPTPPWESSHIITSPLPATSSPATV